MADDAGWGFSWAWAQLGVAALVAATSMGRQEGTAWSASSPRDLPAPPVAPTPPVNSQSAYAVQSGDGWWAIAQAHGVDMGDLLAANGATTATRLNPGQVILLPRDDRRVAPRVAPPRQPPRHTVPSGQQFVPYPGNGLGPTQCADGTWSHSAGRGTCSHHGGIG